MIPLIKPGSAVQTNETTSLPYGTKSINVVEGGLEVPHQMQGDDATIMANAAIIVSLDVPE